MYQDIPDVRECPYNSSHLIRPGRFQFHLIKCSKNHPNVGPLVSCPFNGHHRIPVELKADHTRVCPDKPFAVPLRSAPLGNADPFYKERKSLLSDDKESDRRQVIAEKASLMNAWFSAQDEAERNGFKVPSEAPPISRSRHIINLIKSKRNDAGTAPNNFRFVNDDELSGSKAPSQAKALLTKNSRGTNHILDYIYDGRKNTPLSTIVHPSEAGDENSVAAASIIAGNLRFGDGGLSSAANFAQEVSRFQQNRIGKKKAPGSTIASLLEASTDNVGSAAANVSRGHVVDGGGSPAAQVDAVLRCEAALRTDNDDEEDGWD